MTKLIRAVREGHLNDVQRYLDEAGGRDENGWTALLISVAEKKPKATFLLAPLEQKLVNDAGWSALMYAAYWDRLDCAQLLLGEVTMQSTSHLNGFFPGVTALMISVSKERVDLVALLIPFEHKLVDSQGHTALWYARALGNKQIIALLEVELLEHRSPPTAVIPSLLLAATIGDIQMAKNLITQAGMRNFCGQTALMKAAQYGHLEIARLLIQQEVCSQDSRGCTALMHAAFNGQNDVVQLLLEKEERMQDACGRPALFYAIDNYHKDTALLLLSEADVRDSSECTSFDLGARLGKWDVAKQLLKKTSRFFESLSATARRLRCEYCEAALFLEAHRRPVTPGCTLLMAHILLKDKNSIEDHLHQIGRQDSAGWTALMLSAYTNQLEHVRFLLPFEAGLQTCRISPLADRIPCGSSALMIAASLGYILSTTLLFPLEGGMFNNQKETALVMALQNGNVDCARLLADEAAVYEENGQLHIERIRSLVQEEEADSTLAKTYQAVKDDLEAAVMRQVQKRLEMLAPHHIKSSLPQINQHFEDMDAQELGEAVWSMLFCEHGALKELDDILCEIEDEVDDACVVCLSRQKDAVLMPCRHLVICEDCADQIEHCCPYCRKKVDKALVIEYPEGTRL